MYNDSVSTESVIYLPVLRFIDSPGSVFRGLSVTLYIVHTCTHTPGHSESYPKGIFGQLGTEKEAKIN